LNGPGGEVPALFYSVDRGEPLTLCGQGVAPAAATIERFRDLGYDLIPGTGVLAACVPGAFGGWLLLLQEFGTWSLEDVLVFAIDYETTVSRSSGHASLHRTSGGLDCRLAGVRRSLSAGCRGSGPSSAIPGSRRRTGESSRSRPASPATVRSSARASSSTKGFVAEEIHRFCEQDGGLLTHDDLAAWRATLEPVVSFEYGETTVCKTGAWGAGPVALQQLALLQGFDVGALSQAEFVHVVTECAKLAFADRDALYGDADVPLETLLSRSTTTAARARRG
jgi:gamma-glutamyltranspeptidase/glutathione hydrolase